MFMELTLQVSIEHDIGTGARIWMRCNVFVRMNWGKHPYPPILTDNLLDSLAIDNSTWSIQQIELWC